MINFITISAPSGAGKTTLCKALRSVQPDIEWSISHTTRSKRDIEINGVDYHFITIEKFEELILEEAFAEWENVHGYYYGTTKSNLETVLCNGKTLLLEMDVKGSMSVKKLYPQHTFSIFILPPSLEHLRKRLKNRGTDSDDRIEIRLKRFQQEIEFQNKFDQVMINENLELAKVELINIVNKLKQGVINGT